MQSHKYTPPPPPSHKEVQESADADWKIKYLVRGMAWGIEILAVGAGLGIAYTQYNRGGLLGFFQSGSMIFIIVALLELTKIPLLRAIYINKSFFYRCFFFIAFLIACFMTFETFFISLQMNYNKQIAHPVKLAEPIKIDNKQYTDLSLKQAYNIIENLENKIKDAQFGGKDNRDKIKAFYEKKEDLNKNKTDTLNRIDSDIEKLQNNNLEQRNSIITEYDKKEKGYKSDIKDINTRISKLETDLTDEKKSINESSREKNKNETTQNQKKIDNLTENRKRISNEIQELNTQKEKALTKIQSDINFADKEKSQQIQQKNTEYEEKIKAKKVESENKFNIFGIKSEAYKKLTQEIQQLENALPEEIKKIKTTFDNKIKNLNKDKKAKEQEFNKKIQEKENKKEQLDKEIEELNKKEFTSQTQDTKRLNEIKNEIESEKSKKENIETVLQKMRQERKKKLDALDTDRIKKLQNKKQAESQKFEQNLESIQEKIDALEIKKTMELSDKEMVHRDETTTMEKTIIDIGNKNITYNLARILYKWFGDTDKKFLSQSDLDFVATIWFGSVSILGAILGSIVYLIYLVHTYPPMAWFKPMAFVKTVVSVPTNLFINACVGILQVFGLNRNFSDKPLPTLRGAFRRRWRHILVTLYKRAKTPRPVKIHTVTEIEYKDREVIKPQDKIVYVDKEVPKIIEKTKVVDREVVKVVEKDKIVYVDKEIPKTIEKEVEVEVTKKEYVHVPLYTNDLDLLKKSALPKTTKDKEEE